MTEVDKNPSPTVSFKTLGCRLNQAETAVIKRYFIDAGYRLVPFGDPCDICFVHSCTVTANAERKSLQYCRSAMRRDDTGTVILAGCAVEAAGHNAFADDTADIFFDQHEKFILPGIVSRR